MEGGTKLEMSGKPTTNDPPATYKSLPETDMEDEAVTRPKNLVKLKSNSPEADGADEKMLPTGEKAAQNSYGDDDKKSPSDKQNGEAKLDIGELKSAFVGLGKEELMKYANDPFWVRLRWFLFITFWLLWATMLLGAILIIYAAPKCDPPPPRTWWQKGPLTEVPPDTKIDNLKSLSAKGINGFIVNWMNDAYANVNDSHEIIQLLKQAKKDDLYVIVDLDPSSSFVWFNQSEMKNGHFNDYYLWQAPKSGENGEPKPPNNWLTVANVSSWKFSPTRKEFYYAPFDKPHLNFRNERVINEFINVITKFLDNGASGIRLRYAAFLLTDSKLEDESPGTSKNYQINEYGFYTHTKTENNPELAPLLKKWRNVVKNKTDNGPFMVDQHLSNAGVYKINSSLVVDLPLQSHVFSKSTFVVEDVVHSLNYSFYIDSLDWPLWKATTTAIPKDALNIVTNLLPGATLIEPDDPINSHLLKTRDTPSIMRGDYSFHSIKNNTVFAYIRVTSGSPGTLVVLNPSNERVVVNFSNEIKMLSELKEVTVQLYSKGYNETYFKEINAKRKADAVPVSPMSAIVLSYVPKAKK